MAKSSSKKSTASKKSSSTSKKASSSKSGTKLGGVPTQGQTGKSTTLRGTQM